MKEDFKKRGKMAITISRKHWNKCLPCYKSNRNGKKFMLVNQKGLINWREVKIRKGGKNEIPNTL